MIKSSVSNIEVQPAALQREHTHSEYNNNDNNKTNSRTHTERSKCKVYYTTALASVKFQCIAQGHTAVFQDDYFMRILGVICFFS